MPLTPCPERGELERVLLGILPEAPAEQIEQHVLECQRCVETLVEMGAGDTLVEALRAQPAAAAELAAYRDQVKLVVERWPATAARFDATPSGSAPGEPTSELGPRRTLLGEDEEETIDFLAPSQEADELGRLGNYRVLRVLGSGGMGLVFEAEDLQLKRRVALKAMKRSLAASASSRRRFVREAQVAAAVEHDHIVPIYQVGDDRGIPFIAMPLLRGETLAERLGRVEPSPLPLNEILRIGREIALGLEAAHRAGLIHRDVKPANIWLEAGAGRVKLLDFGLARAASADEHLTQAGALLGTPSYMAPEQGRGEEVDARADLFSLGCVLYHAATGARPFIGRDTMSTLLAVANHEPRSPRELNPEVPAELDALIVSLLSKDPAGRPQSSNEVAERLASVGNGLRVVTAAGTGSEPLEHRSPHAPREGTHHAERDGYGGPSGALSLSPSLLPSVSPASRLVPPRRRRPLAIAAAAAALAAGIVFFIQTNNGTIRVEINDPQIEVAIKGTSLTFKQSDNGADVKLSPGEKTLIVERGDFKFETDKLLLKRGDAATVAVTLSAGTVEAKLGDKLIGQGRLPVEVEGTPSGGSNAPSIARGASTDTNPKRERGASPTDLAASPAPSLKSNAEHVAGWHGWPADAPAPAIAPFDAAQARMHQQEWADYLKLPLEHTNTIGMKFVLIPPGEFMMGSTGEEIEETLKQKAPREYVRSEAPPHTVVLTRPIYLGMHEVTQSEYEVVMRKNPSYFAKSGPQAQYAEKVAGLDTANHPVEVVSWNDAAEFCAKLSRTEGMKPFYFRAGEAVTPLDGTGYRLPTEAEWEFACRAGTSTRFWTGDQEQDVARAGWFAGNSGERTHAVGELRASPFGLYDVHGNVDEWVEDWWEATYYAQFAQKCAINPSGAPSGGSQRVLRGGQWSSAPSVARSSSRSASSPMHNFIWVGFRVALEAEALHNQPSAAKPIRAAADAATAKTASPAPSLNANAKLPAGWHGWPADAPAPALAPFDAAQAKKHQQAWADYLKLPLEHTNTIGMKFVLIPPGEFTMGSTEEEIEVALKDAGDYKLRPEWIESEAPQHNVLLTRPIYLGVHEVTQKAYQAIMGKNPSYFAKTGPDPKLAAKVVDLDTENHPVEGVSWNDAAEFCAKLSRQENLKPFYFRADESVTPLKGTGYRLPTEAEWEFACRAGTTTKFWSGEKDADLVGAAWFGTNSGGRTHEVEELASNPWGLFDVHGNVWEWVEDALAPKYYAQLASKPATNPSGPLSAGSDRVMRGGECYRGASLCRSSGRSAYGPMFRSSNVGFRAVLIVDSLRVGTLD